MAAPYITNRERIKSAPQINLKRFASLYHYQKKRSHHVPANLVVADRYRV
jgi:hypothetical protein